MSQVMHFDDDTEHYSEHVPIPDDDAEAGAMVSEVLEQYLATDDGETVGMSLASIRIQMETQNRILVKMVKTFEEQNNILREITRHLG